MMTHLTIGIGLIESDVFFLSYRSRVKWFDMSMLKLPEMCISVDVPGTKKPVRHVDQLFF